MWKSIVQKQMRYNRDINIRRKVMLFFEANRLGNVSLACARLGYKRSYYYYWWRRLRQANWDISALTERSRRLHLHPKTTSAKKVALIKQWLEKTGYGPLRLAYYLQKEHGITLAPSTIGHILKREGLIPTKLKRCLFCPSLPFPELILGLRFMSLHPY